MCVVSVLCVVCVLYVMIINEEYKYNNIHHCTKLHYQSRILKMIRDVNNIKPTLSSLPLQVMIYFDWHYSVLYFVLNVCIFTYKGIYKSALLCYFVISTIAVRYYYPPSILGWDFCTVFCFVFVQSARLFLGF